MGNPSTLISISVPALNTNHLIKRLYPSERVTDPKKHPASVAFLPYISVTFNCISRLLLRHKSVVLLPRKMADILLAVTDDLVLKM
jgi:hypothetical protein